MRSWLNVSWGLRWLPVASLFLLVLGCSSGDISVSEIPNPEGRTAQGVVRDLLRAGNGAARETILVELATAKRGDRLNFREFWEILFNESAAPQLTADASTAKALYALESNSCAPATHAVFLKFALTNKPGRRHLMEETRGCSVPLSGPMVLEIAREFIPDAQIGSTISSELQFLIAFLDRELTKAPGANWFSHLRASDNTWLRTIAEELTRRGEIETLLDLVISCQRQLKLVPYSDFLRVKLFTTLPLVQKLIERQGFATALRYLAAIARDGEGRFQHLNRAESVDVLVLLQQKTLEPAATELVSVWEDYQLYRSLLSDVTHRRWTLAERLKQTDFLLTGFERKLRELSAEHREVFLANPTGAAWDTTVAFDLFWWATRLTARESAAFKNAVLRFNDRQTAPTDAVDQVLLARTRLHLTDPALIAETLNALNLYCSVLESLGIPAKDLESDKLQDLLRTGVTPGCITLTGDLITFTRIVEGAVYQTPFDFVLRYPGGTIKNRGGELRIGYLDGTLEQLPPTPPPGGGPNP